MKDKKNYSNSNLSSVAVGILFALLPVPLLAGWGPCQNVRYANSYNKIFVLESNIFALLFGLIIIVLATLWLGSALRFKKSSKSTGLINTANMNLVYASLFTIAVLFYSWRLNIIESIAKLLDRSLLHPNWTTYDNGPLSSCTVTNYSLSLAGRFLLAIIAFGVISILAILLITQIIKYKQSPRARALQKTIKTSPWLKLLLVSPLLALIIYLAGIGLAEFFG